MRKSLLFILMKPSILVGGQAVIEGVMMRVPGFYATAVRDPNGKIHIQKKEFTSITETSIFWKKPIFRGMASLYESMKMGMKTLNFSVDIAMPEEQPQSKTGEFFSTIFAIGLAITLFIIAPMWLTTTLMDIEREALWFNLVSGAFRIIFFILYLLIISFLKDVKRLFQYHGAEHRVVYNFESGKDVNIKNAQSFPTQHPRCGTSFVFIIMLVTIFTHAIIDSIALLFLEELTLLTRFILHIVFLPVVAGVGYEVLKFLAKHQTIFIFKILSQPGLWLQHITTKEPSKEQLEVSVRALREAFGKDNIGSFTGKKFVADAIG